MDKLLCHSMASEQLRRCRYDVFLNFRGLDTRFNFVDNLYSALIKKGIHTFKDNLMLGGRRGQEISSQLLKGIEESKIAIVVFSKNYANSRWTLEELAKIKECHDKMGQMVIPLFYHVKPSDVRGLKSDFETAFKEHEDKFKGDIDKVNKWKNAFTEVGNIPGCDIPSDSGGDAGFIDQVVAKVFADTRQGGENNLVGIEPHMEELHKLLNIDGTEKVLMIGIYGMGGLGKTTIARVLFHKISYLFEASSFVRNVRENSSCDDNICAMQKKILWDILETDHDFNFDDPYFGANLIRSRFHKKKVLLVLDDVGDFSQLEFLADSPLWFGPGSRIIITTRNKRVLVYANAKYKPPLLCTDQAVELFSRYGFQENRPPQKYKDVTKRAIGCAGFLPLGLKVLGSFLRGRKDDVWESALDRLDKTPNKTIYDTLKLSFDNLEDSEKKIFLNIACLFKGRKEEDVNRILDSRGLHPKIGIDVLKEKSLITVYDGRLGMHDSIQKMGLQIANEIAPSRMLSDINLIHDLVRKNRELQAIESIVVRQDPKQGLNVDVFKGMEDLRLLDVQHKFTCGEPTFLPDELQWLCWKNYPFSSLPVADKCKLVGLEMGDGEMEYLWLGHKNMLNLKFIHIHISRSLIRFPDVSGAPNIERLVLSYCENLVEVHESLGFLRRLIYLKINFCSELKSLPSRLEMESLETLNLYGCLSLERLPEFSPCMVKVSHIILACCVKIQELPSSIKYLSNLSQLKLTDCTSLKNIPNTICQLKCLENLNLEGCSNLQNLPDEFGRMEKLQELYILVTRSITFHALTYLSSLRKLDLYLSQIGDKDFPENLHEISTLEELNLSGNHLLSVLPESISHLSRLTHLTITHCKRLTKLHGLPSGIQVLNAMRCRSLKNIANLSEDYEWLSKIWVYDSHKLVEEEESERHMDNMIEQSFVKKFASIDASLSVGIPRRKIPSWFIEQHGSKIALKLHPNWQTEILGFAISAVFDPHVITCDPIVDLIFENDGDGDCDEHASLASHDNNDACLAPDDEDADDVSSTSASDDEDADDVSSTSAPDDEDADDVASTSAPDDEDADDVSSTSAPDDGPTWTSIGNLWIGYIPLSLFKQVTEDDEGFRTKDWSYIIQGNIVINLSNFYKKGPTRCGAQIVYKEVESVQQTQPSTFCWKWKLSQTSAYTFRCE